MSTNESENTALVPAENNDEQLKMTVPLVVTIQDRQRATLRIAGTGYDLRQDEYTAWIPVAFRAAPGVKIHGACRFLLQNTEPEFELYATPVNIDPEKPAMAIGYPAVYPIYLANRQGAFATLGLVIFLSASIT